MATHAQRKVMSGAQTIFARILVPVDGSPASHSAAEVAIGLAVAFGGRIRLVYVLDVQRVNAELTMWTGGSSTAILDDIRTAAGASLRVVAESASAAGVPNEIAILEGDVAEQLVVDAAAWKADSVVIGTHSREHAFSPALGSRTAELLRRATIPVLVVR